MIICSWRVPLRCVSLVSLNLCACAGDAAPRPTESPEAGIKTVSWLKWLLGVVGMFQSRAEDLQLFMSQVFCCGCVCVCVCVCIHINYPRRCTRSTRCFIQPRLHRLAYFQALSLNASFLRQVCWRTRSDPREMYDVMFECACDQRRFAVKRFNVGLRKRWMAEHWANWVD